MQQIFAPWRMDWVKRDLQDSSAGDSCIFCHIAEENNDRENRVFARGELGYSVLNIAPYNPGHALVIPYDHINEYVSLDEETVKSLHLLKWRTVRALESAFDPDGFNIGMNIGSAGGASIEDHLHIHVVPRWKRDTTFMPTTANTKVVVEALDESYERARSALSQQDNTKLDGDGDAVDVTV